MQPLANQGAQAIPDPETIDQQRSSYLKVLHDELEHGIRMAQEQCQAQKNTLFQEGEKRKQMYNEEVNKQISSKVCGFEKEAGMRRLELHKKALQHKSALEQEASTRKLDYFRHSAQEELSQRQFQLKQQYDRTEAMLLHEIQEAASGRPVQTPSVVPSALQPSFSNEPQLAQGQFQAPPNTYIQPPINPRVSSAPSFKQPAAVQAGFPAVPSFRPPTPAVGVPLGNARYSPTFVSEGPALATTPAAQRTYVEIPAPTAEFAPNTVLPPTSLPPNTFVGAHPTATANFGPNTGLPPTALPPNTFVGAPPTTFSGVPPPTTFASVPPTTF